MNRRKHLYSIITFVLLTALFTVGCGSATTAEEPAAPDGGQPAATVDWKNIELTDVVTGEKFRVSDFSGKPVLLESFAVWCPTCLAQQKEIAKVLQQEGDAIVHISLDTDPNEDEARVREHVERNGFEWYFAVSPIEMTNALIEDFGFTVVSAPSAPVIIIYEDQSARFLRNGVKSADDLLFEIEQGS